jgi:GntR family transcriptional regulator, transcriptional repressor for pyruvate dehydrogenase complex
MSSGRATGTASQGKTARSAPTPLRRSPARARAPKWEQVKAESLSAQIVNQVRTSLFERKFRPGDFLGTETSLAEQFGVSRMASRDALRSLAASGIVTIRQGARGGAWISEGAVDHLGDALAIQLTLLGVSSVDVLELQTGLEAIASELAAERATDEDVARLKELLVVLNEAAGTPKRYASLAFDLHEQIMKITRNDALLAQFRGIRLLLEPVLVARANATYVRESQTGHRALVKLIAARDSEGARAHAYSRMESWRARRLKEATTE